MTTINERMQIIVDKLFNGNKRQFALAVGIAPTGITNYIGDKRASQPSAKILANIVLKTSVDAHWLLTGTGDMIRDNQSDINEVYNKDSESHIYLDMLKQLLACDTAMYQMEQKKRSLYEEIVSYIK